MDNVKKCAAVDPIQNILADFDRVRAFVDDNMVIKYFEERGILADPIVKGVCGRARRSL